MSGICWDKITQTFQTYSLSAAESTIHKSFKRNSLNLSKLPVTIAGDVDFMVSLRYFKFHPKLVFQIGTGLSLSESVFVGPSEEGVNWTVTQLIWRSTAEVIQIKT